MVLGWKRRLALAVAVVLVAGGTATAATIQAGGLRLTVLGQILPYRLPRHAKAPIAVFISGHVGTNDGSVPPQLQRMVIDVNRQGVLRTDGLPTCSEEELHPASTDRALTECGDALIGSGRFWASVVFPEQRPYPTRGRLLVFNGRRDGKPVLFAHIYTVDPFNTSFVIAFAIRHIGKGRFGTRLSASFPKALGEWGFVDRIKLTLRRHYRFHGSRRSFFNASCPAPQGASVGNFVLADASFYFADRKPIKVSVAKSCGVKE